MTTLTDFILTCMSKSPRALRATIADAAAEAKHLGLRADWVRHYAATESAGRGL